MRVFLGLGSNLGDRLHYLRRGVGYLPDVVQVSSVYETEPVEVDDAQGTYFNIVVELETDLPAQEILKAAQAAEAAAGRVRTSYHGARTLDVDVLLYGDAKIDEPGLQVPHPRMWQRRFVVEPLAEIAPDMVPDGWDQSVNGEVWVAGTL
jgi:2-amino-4-hydroxy-6-hydroxymethyldihydropteridine diphosphokinase